MNASQIEITIQGDRQSGKTTAAIRMLRAHVDEGQIGAYFLENESHCRSMTKGNPNLNFAFTAASSEGRIMSMLPPQVAVFDLDHGWHHQDLIAVMRKRMMIHPRSTVILVRN